jgi:hypothetical protein
MTAQHTSSSPTVASAVGPSGKPAAVVPTSETMSQQTNSPSTVQGDLRSDRGQLRLPAGLLLGGVVTYILVTFLHTGGPANDHKVIFGDYAGSHDWAAVHLAQFAGMALIIAGLLTLHAALDVRAGAAAVLARLGAVFAAVALGLYGVLQAVDGVALKQAVDAWASSSGADRSARFANAETVRWLEWGTHSYHSVMLGLALVLFGVAMALSKRLPAVIGWLAALSGLSYLAQGWILGTHGFSAEDSITIEAGYVLTLTWAAWLTVLAFHPSQLPELVDRGYDR